MGGVGEGGVFSREVFSKVVIFLSKIRPTHTQLLSSPIFMYTCNSDFEMLFCCALAYTITANCVKLCLPSFASPSCCTVRAFCLHNCMYYGIKRWVQFQQKNTSCNNFIYKKGVGLFSRVGLFSSTLLLAHTLVELALFPGLQCLQYLITSSMPNVKGNTLHNNFSGSL